jgi:cobalamin synthase
MLLSIVTRRMGPRGRCNYGAKEVSDEWGWCCMHGLVLCIRPTFLRLTITLLRAPLLHCAWGVLVLHRLGRNIRGVAGWTIGWGKLLPTVILNMIQTCK